MIALELDADELDAMRRGVGATEEIGRQALRAAVNKTVRWANTRVRRAVAAAAEMPQRVLTKRHRFDVRPARGPEDAAIWIGMNAVSAIHLGARQTKVGVRAGKRRWDGAFIGRGQAGQTKGAGHLHVFQRRGKTWISKGVRGPIDKVTVPIHDAGMEALRGPILAGIEAQFIKTFRHELEWRMSRVA